MKSRIDSTRLGFGCAAIPGALTQREALTLLETAFACGIRHFDTARMYGSGKAEGVLAALVRARREELALVTKAGLAPPSRFARALGKLGLALPMRDRVRFQPVRILRSVETSLRELGTDHLDALLLHEIRPHHVSDELKRLVQELRADGKIGAVGIATSVADSEALIATHPELCDIVQVPVQWLDRRRALPANARLIIHSVLSERLSPFLNRLKSDEELARRLKKEAGLTAADAGKIGRLMLQSAMLRNPDGVTLFSTSRLDRIRSNAALLSADPDMPALRALEREMNALATARRNREPAR